MVAELSNCAKSSNFFTYITQAFSHQSPKKPTMNAVMQMTKLLMKPARNPFTTSRRYAICPDCLSAFDPVSRYPYTALPDDCDGVVERLWCDACQPKSRVDGGTRNVGLAVLAAIFGLLGIAGTILWMVVNL